MGATQNENEELHHLIWAFCSKAIFQSLETVQLCVTIAVSLWNRGGDSITQTMKNMGVEQGTKVAWHEKDKTKIARKETRQKHLASFVRSSFTLMKTQDWVKTSVLFFDNDICPTILASGVSLLVIISVIRQRKKKKIDKNMQTITYEAGAF